MGWHAGRLLASANNKVVRLVRWMFEDGFLWMEGGSGWKGDGW